MLILIFIKAIIPYVIFIQLMVVIYFYSQFKIENFRKIKIYITGYINYYC
jgi:hypothetical protein